MASAWPRACTRQSRSAPRRKDRAQDLRQQVDKVEAANAGQSLVDLDKVQVILGSWGQAFPWPRSHLHEPRFGHRAFLHESLVTKGNPYYSASASSTRSRDGDGHYAKKNSTPRRRSSSAKFPYTFRRIGQSTSPIPSLKLTGDKGAILGTSTTKRRPGLLRPAHPGQEPQSDVIFAPATIRKAPDHQAGRELESNPFLGGGHLGDRGVHQRRKASSRAPSCPPSLTMTPLTPNSKTFVPSTRRSSASCLGHGGPGYDGYLLARCHQARRQHRSLQDPRRHRRDDQVPGASGYVTFAGAAMTRQESLSSRK